MTSFVSAILHNSANKLESMSMLGSKHNNNNSNHNSNGIHHKNKSPRFGNKQNNHQIPQQQPQGNLASRLAMHASTPILTSSTNSSNGGGYYYHPQMSYSAEYIPAPPPYDTQQQQIQQQQHMHSPTPTPSTSWTSEMSALAEKIKDDVTSTIKERIGTGKAALTMQQESNIDRHSISQGMKLVSIAADEYEEGNESVALDIYLTGVDKILMALPNKTDMSTKMIIREKLQSVEERVGILNLASSHKKMQQQTADNNDEGSNISSSVINSFILSRIASTISTISSKAYQSATVPSVAEDTETLAPAINRSTASPMPTISIEGGGDSMTRFKKFGQYMIDIAVTCAILIKRSPLPDLVSFLFSYMIQLFLWIDAQYHIIHKAQNLGIKCIKFGLQADEQYRLHEFVSEGLYIIIAAGLKAAVAFKEAPRYEGEVSSYRQQPIRNNSEPPSNITASVSERISSSARSPPINIRRNSDPAKIPCTSTTPQKTRASWVWSPW